MSKQKIKKLIIGSNNIGKIKEIRALIPSKIKIYTTKSLKIKSPKETGRTFLENSLIKAKYFSKISNKVCIADDSGLEIDLLNRAPGIFSARWGGVKNNFDKAIERVFIELCKKDKNWKKKIIKARFICALTIFWPSGNYINSIGIIEGTISKIKRGNKGFGYDPIFIPKGKKLTFGEMEPLKKLKIDHRYLAFKKIKKFL